MATAVLCLALLALLSVVQVAHVHKTQTDADHCQLCVVLHSVVPAAPQAAAVVLVPLGLSLPALDTETVARQWHATYFIRPPPAGS